MGDGQRVTRAPPDAPGRGTGKEGATRPRRIGARKGGRQERRAHDVETSSGGTAPARLIVDGEYSDERFIDMMAAHHRMATEMAKVGRERGERPEVRQLSEGMISDQQGEIEELSFIKEKNFGPSEVATTMNPEDPSMFAMLMPDRLAEQQPFDRAFIDSNVPHHAAVVEMAGVALMQSENPEIKRLARRIIDAQSREVGRMTGWRQQWYPEG